MRSHSRFVTLLTLILGIAAFYAPAYAQEKPQTQKPLLSSFGFGSNKEQNHETSGFADLAERLLPSVVNISSTQKSVAPEDFPEMPEFPPGSPFEDFFEQFMDKRGNGGPSQPSASLGSGFIIDAEKGLIVTNNHVIKDADEIRITLHDDTTLTAKVLGKDEKTDLAILQVPTDKAKLVAVAFGDSDHMRIGDWILAIGNPFGLGGTVTRGIISARQRDIQAGPYDDFIQTDASINRGNSGGPMFNLKGEVIGINTAIFSPSGGSVGIGFAIPSNLASPVIKQLLTYGRTRRGWIGVRIQSVTQEIAESLGLDKPRGALIAGITPKGPAEVAGLQAGDIILSFNNATITDVKSLPRKVAETPIDASAKISVWRNGKTIDTSIKVGELEKAEGEGLIDGSDMPKSKVGPASQGTKVPEVGFILSTITDMDRETYGMFEKVKGVLVQSVIKGSEAEQKGLSEGDVLVEINQQAVTSPVIAAEMIASAKKAGRTSVLLLVDTQGKGDVRFVALRLKE